MGVLVDVIDVQLQEEIRRVSEEKEEQKREEKHRNCFRERGQYQTNYVWG